jgi:hypothetical protein
MTHMKDAIVEKLRQHLSTPIDTECKVVYLLCEVRKLLEKEPARPEMFALRLYCHWALHVDLSYGSTTLHFLEKVDGYIAHKLYLGETNEALIEEQALFHEFVYLETFRQELSKFLASYALPTEVCEEDVRWFTFLAAYAGVIQDGSLSCQGRGEDTLRVVAKVTFSKGDRATADGHVPFDMRWDVLLKDKRRVEIEVGTLPNHKLMHWGLRLA